MPRQILPSSVIFLSLALCGATVGAQAAGTTVSFSGVTSLTMGGMAAGTPFTGVFTYDPAAPSSGDAPYYNGTQTIYPAGFTQLAMTIGGQTVTESAPGTITLFNNVQPPNSIPVGDSLYTFNPLNGQGPNPSSGSFAGLTPNFIYLGFVDNTGQAFSSTQLPASLTTLKFNEAFVGINFGPLGAGNTTTISSISLGSSVPEPSVAAMAGVGLLWLCAVARHRRAFSLSCSSRMAKTCR